MNLRRLGAIVLKELRQLRRDKLTFAMIAGIPLLELVLFGYAINMDVRGIEAAVLDQANTAQSREAVAEIASSQVINIQYHLHDPQQIDQLLRQGYLHAADGGLAVTPAGAEWFAHQGIDTTAAARRRRMLCRPCLDWSERRHHLGGALGAALLQRLLERGWARRDKDSRVLHFSAEGELALRAWLAPAAGEAASNEPPRPLAAQGRSGR